MVTVRSMALKSPPTWCSGGSPEPLSQDSVAFLPWKTPVHYVGGTRNWLASISFQQTTYLDRFWSQGVLHHMTYWLPIWRNRTSLLLLFYYAHSKRQVPAIGFVVCKALVRQSQVLPHKRGIYRVMVHQHTYDIIRSSYLPESLQHQLNQARAYTNSEYSQHRAISAGVWVFWG